MRPMRWLVITLTLVLIVIAPAIPLPRFTRVRDTKRDTSAPPSSETSSPSSSETYKASPPASPPAPTTTPTSETGRLAKVQRLFRDPMPYALIVSLPYVGGAAELVVTWAGDMWHAHVAPNVHIPAALINMWHEVAAMGPGEGAVVAAGVTVAGASTVIGVTGAVRVARPTCRQALWESWQNTSTSFVSKPLDLVKTLVSNSSCVEGVVESLAAARGGGEAGDVEGVGRPDLAPHTAMALGCRGRSDPVDHVHVGGSMVHGVYAPAAHQSTGQSKEGHPMGEVDGVPADPREDSAQGRTQDRHASGW